MIPFLATPFNEGDPNLSPNGRFLAYSSNESGRFEVYVQRFPEGGGKVQVSAQGGVQPRWRGDGRELYYVEGETLLAVAVTSAPDFSVGKAVRLFEQKGITRDGGQQYDVSADGQRFVLVEPVAAKPPPPFGWSRTGSLSFAIAKRESNRSADLISRSAAFPRDRTKAVGPRIGRGRAGFTHPRAKAAELEVNSALQVAA